MMKKITSLVLAAFVGVSCINVVAFSADSKLPVVGTKENYIKLLKDIQGSNPGIYRYGLGPGPAMMTNGVADTAVAKSEAPVPAPESAPADYSATNVQVNGVDESDIIKSDGESIFYVHDSKVSIVKATPAKDMKEQSTIKFDDEDFTPVEMYVQNKQLIIVGQTGRRFFVNGNESYDTMSEVYVYDVSDKANPKKVRNVQTQGNQIDSRVVGNSLYLLSNGYIYSVTPNNFIMPSYRDSAVSTCAGVFGLSN